MSKRHLKSTNNKHMNALHHSVSLSPEDAIECKEYTTISLSEKKNRKSEYIYSYVHD